ncbi:MAG TPA: polysaccharide biosynthesis/export family protein [Terriglobales bacterium]|nr:polysaccharide biosynthesis/export family protein [Terriglobales bacterium]
MFTRILSARNISQLFLFSAFLGTTAFSLWGQAASNSSASKDSSKTAAAGATIASTTTASPTTASVPSQSAPDATSLVVGNGDLINVSVEGAPDFSKDVRVNPRGEISLPMVGAIKVAGLTVEQAQEAVAKRLQAGGYFNNPQVTIFEKEYATQGISVLGEVQKPGIYPLFGPHSVLDAISAAGGTTPKAGNTILLTRRDQPNLVQTIPLDFKKEQGGQSNVAVNPGDTVVVSKAGIVYVVGDVRQPSGFVMENSHLTVLQAIAMAQGANPTASLGHAKLIRKSSEGAPQEIPIELNKIMKAKAPDLQLQAEDILFVPSSTAKNIARGLGAIVQSASGAAIYHY